MRKLLLVISLVFFAKCQNLDNLADVESILTQNQACWLQSYGRGVGKPISTCPDGSEQDGLLCYPPCQDGYTGVGPVCWQNCPDGFSDTGADCLKPEAYGRGAGYALWDQGKCQSENPQGCEQNGLLYYPLCAANFHSVGCCICSPDCPSGWTDIGVSCQKGSYGRTAGTPLICTADQQEDAGLCYTHCSDGYTGIGPVCWGSCPAGMAGCGAMCVGSSEECVDQMLQIGSDALDITAALAGGAEDPEIDYAAAEAVVDLVNQLAIPICGS